jgi:hypothetical protein
MRLRFPTTRQGALVIWKYHDDRRGVSFVIGIVGSPLQIEIYSPDIGAQDPSTYNAGAHDGQISDPTITSVMVDLLGFREVVSRWR